MHKHQKQQVRHSFLRSLHIIAFGATLLLSTNSSAQNQTVAIEGFNLSLSGSRFAANQASRPDLAILEVPSTQSIYIDNAGQFEIHTKSQYPGGFIFDFHIKGNKTGMATVDKLFWRNGNEIDRTSADVASQTYADQTLLFPHFLQSQAQQTNSLVTPIEFSNQYEFKQFTDRAGRPITATVRRKDQQIVVARVGNLTYNYSAISDLVWQVDILNTGTPIASWRVEMHPTSPRSIDLNFDKTYEEKSDRGEPSVEEIALGVLRVNDTPSNYHSHFIVGDDAILAFDAPVSAIETAEAKKLIAQKINGKPIQYVALSHTHRDHIAGLSTYLNDSREILLGRGGSIALARQFGKATYQVREVTKNSSIDLGNRIIHIFPVNSSHSSDNIVVYDEKSGVLLQGDLFTLGEHGPVAKAFDVNQELLDLINRENLRISAIVGVHGRRTTLEELKESIRLRNH